MGRVFALVDMPYLVGCCLWVVVRRAFKQRAGYIDRHADAPSHRSNEYSADVVYIDS